MAGDDKKNLSRRDLLTFWRRAREPEPPAPVAPAPEPSLQRWLRPPGMMHEDMLRNLCTHCGKCVQACPAEAIFPLPATSGALAGTPAIHARTQPCVLCNGLLCTHVCPSGALIPVFLPSDVAMGTARLDAARCVTYHGQACDKCVDICPIPGALVVASDGTVRVDDKRCVGCGLCEQRCPTQPSSIVVEPRQ